MKTSLVTTFLVLSLSTALLAKGGSGKGGKGYYGSKNECKQDNSGHYYGQKTECKTPSSNSGYYSSEPVPAPSSTPTPLPTSTPTARKGGAKPEDKSRPARGSAAWFVYETAEHGTEGLLASSLLTQDSASALSVELTTAATSSLIVTAGSDIAENCRMEDHWSKSGTVLKKEVYCDHSPYYAPLTKLQRGSNLWALVEGVEKSIRHLFVENSSTQLIVDGASAKISGNQVSVEISMQNGNIAKFNCVKGNHLSNSNTTLKIDLNCLKI